VAQQLKNLGVRVLVLWECELRRPSYIEKRLVRFLGPTSL
jgi:G:T-mismatch repair DNA endonuclease (very short patch repair protein)